MRGCDVDLVLLAVNGVAGVAGFGLVIVVVLGEPGVAGFLILGSTGILLSGVGGVGLAVCGVKTFFASIGLGVMLDAADAREDSVSLDCGVLTTGLFAGASDFIAEIFSLCFCCEDKPSFGNDESKSNGSSLTTGTFTSC